jgi:photosystem I reaction center subunit XII
METIIQLVAIIAVVTVGPVVIILLAARKGNLLFFFMNISDNQVFIALFIALITSTLALRLGIELYEGASTNP